MSYAHIDDDHGRGSVSALRVELEGELRVQTGRRDVRIFRDRDDIEWGRAWKDRIDSALDTVTFLVPVMTPSFFASEQCRRELQRFIERERRLGRDDLILPIYWIRSPVLEDLRQPISEDLVVLAGRQYADFRRLRLRPSGDPDLREAVARLAEHIHNALNREDLPNPSAEAIRAHVVTEIDAAMRDAKEGDLPEVVDVVNLLVDAVRDMAWLSEHNVVALRWIHQSRLLRPPGALRPSTTTRIDKPLGLDPAVVERFQAGILAAVRAAVESAAELPGEPPGDHAVTSALLDMIRDLLALSNSIPRGTGHGNLESRVATLHREVGTRIAGIHEAADIAERRAGEARARAARMAEQEARETAAAAEQALQHAQAQRDEAVQGRENAVADAKRRIEKMRADLAAAKRTEHEQRERAGAAESREDTLRREVARLQQQLNQLNQPRHLNQPAGSPKTGDSPQRQPQRQRQPQPQPPMPPSSAGEAEEGRAAASGRPASDRQDHSKVLPSSGLRLHYAIRSDTGHVREGNEDSAYAGPFLLAVADGNGRRSGDVASSTVISELAVLDGRVSDDDDLLETLARSVRNANAYLREMLLHDKSLEGMHTTITAMLFSGDEFTVLHVGDSRAYLLRDADLLQVTHDHTLVQDLVDQGRITWEQAYTHPQRSLLTRALHGRDVEPDLSVREAVPGDRYLLCTDGLTDVVPEETILDALLLAAPQDAVDRLVDLALKGGGPDNITVVVADVIDDVPDTGAEPLLAGAAAEMEIPGASAARTGPWPNSRTPAPAPRRHRRPASAESASTGQAIRRETRTSSHAPGRPGRDPTPGIPVTTPQRRGAARIGRIGFHRTGHPPDNAEHTSTTAGTGRPRLRWLTQPIRLPQPLRTRRALVVSLTVLVLVVASTTGTWAWVNSQYYVGIDGDRVAVFRGIDDESPIPGLGSTRVWRSDRNVADFAEDVQEQLGDGVDVSSEDAGIDYILRLPAKPEKEEKPLIPLPTPSPPLPAPPV